MRADSSLVTYKGENNNTVENGWHIPQEVLCLGVSEKLFIFMISDWIQEVLSPFGA